MLFPHRWLSYPCLSSGKPRDLGSLLASSIFTVIIILLIRPCHYCNLIRILSAYRALSSASSKLSFRNTKYPALTASSIESPHSRSPHHAIPAIPFWIFLSLPPDCCTGKSFLLMNFELFKQSIMDSHESHSDLFYDICKGNCFLAPAIP